MSQCGVDRYQCSKGREPSAVYIFVLGESKEVSYHEEGLESI
jgi:hypothetical protein